MFRVGLALSLAVLALAHNSNIPESKREVEQEVRLLERLLNEVLHVQQRDEEAVVAAEPALFQPTLKIGSFNVQVFGIKKMDDPVAKDALLKILPRYDIVLIMEIRDKSETAFPELIDALNGDGDEYAYVISERLGRSSSKEQYAYMYRKSKLSLVDTFQYDDSNGDVFQREPFAVLFHCDTTEVQDFALLGCHTDPDEAVSETSALADAYDAVVNHWNLEDVLVMGDLNADCTYVTSREWDDIKLWTDDRFKWLITNDADTTTKGTDCAYDRLIAAGGNLQRGIEPKSAQIYRFDQVLGLNQEETEDVSDHYPVELELRGKVDVELLSKLGSRRSFTVSYNEAGSALPEGSSHGFTLRRLDENGSPFLLRATLAETREPMTSLRDFQSACPESISDSVLDLLDEYLKEGMPGNVPKATGREVNTDTYSLQIEYDLTNGNTYYVTVSKKGL